MIDGARFEQPPPAPVPVDQAAMMWAHLAMNQKQPLHPAVQRIAGGGGRHGAVGAADPALFSPAGRWPTFNDIAAAAAESEWRAPASAPNSLRGGTLDGDFFSDDQDALRLSPVPLSPRHPPTPSTGGITPAPAADALARGDVIATTDRVQRRWQAGVSSGAGSGDAGTPTGGGGSHLRSEVRSAHRSIALFSSPVGVGPLTVPVATPVWHSPLAGAVRRAATRGAAARDGAVAVDGRDDDGAGAISPAFSDRGVSPPMMSGESGAAAALVDAPTVAALGAAAGPAALPVPARFPTARESARSHTPVLYSRGGQPSAGVVVGRGLASAAAVTASSGTATPATTAAAAAPAPAPAAPVAAAAASVRDASDTVSRPVSGERRRVVSPHRLSVEARHSAGSEGARMSGWAVTAAPDATPSATVAAAPHASGEASVERSHATLLRNEASPPAAGSLSSVPVTLVPFSVTALSPQPAGSSSASLESAPGGSMSRRHVQGEVARNARSPGSAVRPPPPPPPPSHIAAAAAVEIFHGASGHGDAAMEVWRPVDGGAEACDIAVEVHGVDDRNRGPELPVTFVLSPLVSRQRAL
jgi:hypothetical protein